MEKENNTLETELSVAKKLIDEQEKELAELYTLQDKFEQYTRKQSLEICGIPDSAHSSTEDAVFQLTETLDVPLSPGDINMVTALVSGSSAPDWSPGGEHCVVFLGKTLNSHSASLYPSV